METAERILVRYTELDRGPRALALRRCAFLASIMIASVFTPENRAQFTTISTAPAYVVEVPTVASPTNSPSTFSTSATASALGGFPNAGSIIGLPPPAVGNTFSVPDFTPAPPQTNAMIGVPFQPGSRGFIMAVAGLRPNGTSAMTPPTPESTATPVLLQQQPPRPVIVYRRAAAGSGALMTRETETEEIESYPVGAIVRRGAAPAVLARPVPRTAVPVVTAPAPAMRIAESISAPAGPVVIREFRHGAFLK